VLHDRGVRLTVAEHPEAVEHLKAELVRRCDGRRVEFGEGSGHPLAATSQFLWRTSREHRLERAEWRGGHALCHRIGQAVLD
jgi:hypothetical protein